MRQTMWPTISVRVPVEVYKQINGQAMERDVPASVVIREALTRAFGQEVERATIGPNKGRMVPRAS